MSLIHERLFDRSCISQTSSRNSTMKLSQPLRRTSYCQHCISFLAPSVLNNLPNELKRCSNLNTFKHRIKEYFIWKIRQKDNASIFTTRLSSSQQLMHFFSIFFFFFVILPYLSLPVLSKDHDGNKATWVLIFKYTFHLVENCKF